MFIALKFCYTCTLKNCDAFKSCTFCVKWMLRKSQDELNSYSLKEDFPIKDIILWLVHYASQVND